jgi:uncharacterized Zn finger protein
MKKIWSFIKKMLKPVEYHSGDIEASCSVCIIHTPHEVVGSSYKCRQCGTVNVLTRENTAW